MLNPSNKQILKEEGDSKYTMVMVIAKRARQIVDGSESLVETKSNKPVTIALEEFLQDKIEFSRPEIKGIK